MALAIQGCTDDEALTTLTDVAIIGGAVAVGVAAANAPQPPPPPRRGPDRGPGPGGPRRFSEEIDLGSVSDVSSISLTAPQESETQKMAAHYNLPLSAAQTLTNTLQESVQTRSLQPVYDLGLSDSDLQDIGANMAVSNVAINNISAKLNISEDLAKSVLQQMQKDARQSLYAHH